MKKICFFLPTLNFGGIEANTIRLAKSFVDSGYKVDLVAGTINGEYLKRINEQINVVSLNKKSLQSMLFPLVRYMKKEKPTVVITGGEGANILLCLAKGIVPKAKIIISIRTQLTIEYKETKSVKKKKIFPFLSRKLYKKADKIVAVSQGVADDASEFLEIPRQKINVIYNPILDDSLLKLKNEENNHKWFIDEDKKVIVAVGRLVNQKDFLTLIHSFNLVRNKMDNVKLLILGDGPQRESLQSEIDKKKLGSEIEIVGFVQNPYSYMSNSDLFVLSSKWEGFGNVIVEALATGVPVVSTNCPSGPSEILDHGKYGRLVEVKNAEQLSYSILAELKTSSASRVKRIQRAQEFTVEISKDKYQQIIKEL